MRISDWSSDVCSSDLQNEREPVMTARFGIGAKHAEQPIGPDRARRPGSLAIDDIVIAVTHGLAADRRNVRTRARFRPALRPDVLSRRHARQTARLLLVGTVFHQRRSQQESAILVDAPRFVRTPDFLFSDKHSAQN